MATKHSTSIPKELINAFSTHGVVAFVGAGVSMNAKLPSWKTLVQELFNEHKDIQLDDAENESIQRHIDSGNYPLVMDYLFYKYGNPTYRNFLTKTITSQDEPSNVHRYITSIPFKGIITTNFDVLLSKAKADFAIPFNYCDEHLRENCENSEFIIHAHGRIDQVDRLINTSTQFEELMDQQKYGEFWGLMHKIFQDHVVLFIGYSLNDFDFTSMLTKIKSLFNGHIKKHFVLFVKDDIDVLDDFRIKTSLGLQALYIKSDGDIGKAHEQWLKTLQTEVRNYMRRSTLPEKLSSRPFPEYLYSTIEFLTRNYSTSHSINGLRLGSFDFKEYLDGHDPQLFWEQVFINASDDEIKKLIKALYSRHHHEEELFVNYLSNL